MAHYNAGTWLWRKSSRAKPSWHGTWCSEQPGMVLVATPARLELQIKQKQNDTKKTYVTLYSPWQHLVAHPSPAKKENAIHTEMQSLYHKILSWLPLAFMAGLPFSAFMAVVAFMPFMAFMALATI